MVSIGWFPGHMASARKKAAETMAKVDIVLEVLDARIPGASTNPMIGELRRHRQRPALRILNKADAADPAATAAWLASYAKEKDVLALALSAKSPADVAKILPAARKLAPHRDSPEKPLRILVMGIPNVGKSTLLNALVKRKVAKTGDEPAVTKHQSRHDLGPQAEIIDTPGLMWPKIEHESDGLMLAAAHAIGENAFIDEEVALFLAGLLLERYPALIAARYGKAAGDAGDVALIDAIALRRGFRVRGGGFDREKAGLALINDFRSGALGRISLETPESRARMIEKSSQEDA